MTIRDLLRSEYSYLEGTTIDAWTWEIIRRNHAYEDAWADHAHHPDRELNPEDISTLDQKETDAAARFGLLFFIDPDRNSDSVHPFWSPSHNPCVLKCRLSPRDKRDKSSGAVFSNLSCEHAIVHTHDGEQHLLLSYEKWSLQLAFDPDVDLHGNVYFEIGASGPGILKQQIAAISCLDRLLKGGRFPPSYCAMPAQFHMTPELLYALDLARCGLSQKEIARRIFGGDAVLTGWDGVSDHVRAKTRRLITKARRLIKHGCLAFFDNH